MAVCALCLSSLPVVGSSGRTDGRQGSGLAVSWAPSSSSLKLSIFGRSLGLHQTSRRLSLGPAGSGARCSRNVILSMANDDDLQAKLAKDIQSIEELLPDFDELDKDELQQFLDLELESSLDYERFRHYEIMYMIHEKHADVVQDVIKKVQDYIIENKGKIHRLNDWGMRNLAYDIQKAKRANYLLMNIEIDSQAVNGLNFLLEKDERVIRHMVMSQKVAITEDSVPPEEYRTYRDVEEDEDEEDEDWDDEEDGEEEEEEEATELALQRE